MTKEIENHVSRCSTCQEYQNLPQLKPLLPHCIPSRPWQMVGTVDLFWWNGANYLLIVDYYSNFFEICLLSNIRSATVIQHTKSIFARHGIPDVMISDNGPQYYCQDYKDFASKWGFTVVKLGSLSLTAIKLFDLTMLKRLTDVFIEENKDIRLKYQVR